MSDLVEIGRFHFRFQCQPGCTNCCTQQGEVYLTPADVSRMAAYLRLTRAAFRRRYCETDADGDLRLTTPNEGHCHFLEGSGCIIHEAKPLQCRAFPFWPEHVANKRAWKNLKQHCPGVGVGSVLPVAEVRAAAQACKDAFPDL